MPKYNVIVTSDTSVSTVVDVEADSPEQAEQLALEEARNSPNDFEWVDDEWTLEPYLADEAGNNATLIE